MTFTVQRNGALWSIAKCSSRLYPPPQGRCFVLPADAKDGVKGIHMELLKLFDVSRRARAWNCWSCLMCPDLEPIEERCENNDTVDPELCEQSNVVLVEHPSAKPHSCLAWLADPRGAFSVYRSTAGNAARIPQLGAINRDGWLKSISVRCCPMKTFVSPRLMMVIPKHALSMPQRICRVSAVGLCPCFLVGHSHEQRELPGCVFDKRLKLN